MKKKPVHTFHSHPINSVQHPDYLLVIMYIAFSCFSIILVYSSSTTFSLRQTGDPYYLFYRHLAGILISCGVTIIAYFLPLSFLRKNNTLISLLVLMLLITPLIPGIGAEIGGTKRWISFGGIRFQPSEVVRILIIFYLSFQLSRWESAISSPEMNREKYIVLLFSGITCLFILLQKDFSTTILCFTTIFCLLYLGNMPIKFLLWIAMIGFVVGIPFVIFSPYRLERIDMLLHFKNNPENAYQIYQSLNAFTRGGFIGVGPGDGKHNIPYIFNDFIFAASAEEFGFVGTIFIVILFFLFLQRGFKIALNIYQQDIYLALIAFGLTFSIVFQALVNMCVNMAIIFPTGITLPFVSYGRSSFIMSSFAMGILLQLSNKVERY